MADESMEAQDPGNEEFENSMDFTIEESMLMPIFKKNHINTRSIADFIATGDLSNYHEENNKRNALRQACTLFKLVNGELYRHGSTREYNKYGLRIVVHDDEPQKKLDILAKCHVDEEGNHLGMNNTIKKVSELYYWQGVSAHVKLFLKKCGLCKIRSKMDTDTWLIEEKKTIAKKKEKNDVCMEAKKELKNLGRVKKPTSPETFFIVNAERKIDLDKLTEEAEMMIDSNNIEYVVETLGSSEEGLELPEVCHVFNVPDIVPIPNRYRSREIENFLRNGTYPDDFTMNQKAGLRGPAAQYTIIEDELYHEGNKKGSKGMRLVVHDDQPALKVKIMVECHLDEEGTHLGLNRTMGRVSEKYFWVGLSLDVRKFMMNCKVCMLTRGKKMGPSNDIYMEEVHKLKSKHMEKHGESVETEQYEALEEIPAEVHQQDVIKSEEGYGHQIIRLVGPNEDVTEITVAVVNGDLATEGLSEEQYAALSVASGFETETIAVENTETVTVENADNVTEEAEKQTEVVKEELENVISIAVAQSNQEEQATAADNAEGTNGDSGENRVEEASPEEMSAVEAAIGMIINKDKEDVIPSTSAEAKKELDSDYEEITVNSEATNEGESVSKTAEEPEPASGPSQNVASKTGAFSFYEDIIYVPRLDKTKAMMAYLASPTPIIIPGYTSSRMAEMTKTFILKDGLLYRRVSRYKGEQIVICDDSPEMKLKIVNGCHVKANGKHFSEMLTLRNVQYKYYWEELKWDVHRFYVKCNKCVKAGEDVRLKRRVLSVAEKKQEEILAKRQRDLGITQKRNREFRKRHQTKLERFKMWHKYGKDKGEYMRMMEEAMDDLGEEEEALAENLDGTTMLKQDMRHEDESDIEINMPGSEDETEGATRELSSSIGEEQLYRVVLYASLEQEDAASQLFLDRGWTYRLDSIHKFLDDTPEQGETFDSRRHVIYELSMYMRLDQEKAMREMFDVNGWQYSLEELEPVKVVVVKPTTPAASPGKRATRSRAGTPKASQVSTPQWRRSPRQKPEATDTTPQRKTILVDPEWEEETVPKGFKRSLDTASLLDTASPADGRRSSRREIKRPRRYSPDTDEDKVKVKLESGLTPTKQPVKQVKKEVSQAVSDSEMADTPRRQTRHSNVSKHQEDSPVKTTSAAATRSQASQKETVALNKSLSDTQKANVKSIPSSKATIVPIDTEEKTLDEDLVYLDHAEEVVEGEDSYMLEQEEDDDDLDDDSEDDYDEDESEVEDGNKTLAIFEDPDFPADKTEVDQFLKKDLIDVCQICSRVFKKSQQAEYQAHVDKHGSGVSHACDKCSKVFLDGQCLQVHQRVHTGVSPESCSVCTVDFSTSFQLAAHMYKVHGECTMFSCDICKAKFVNISFLKTEMLFDGELSFFKCVMCRK